MAGDMSSSSDWCSWSLEIQRCTASWVPGLGWVRSAETGAASGGAASEVITAGRTRACASAAGLASSAGAGDAARRGAAAGRNSAGIEARARAAASSPPGEASQPAATGVARAQAPAATRIARLARDRGRRGDDVMIISTRFIRYEPEAPATQVRGDCR